MRERVTHLPAGHATTQVAPDATGQLVVHDLFATFDMARLPNVTNAPTLARLTRFIHEDLGQSELQPARYTVRELVSELCKFNTSGTLCWNLAATSKGHRLQRSAPHGDRSRTLPASLRDTTADVAMAEMAATQRIFAHCAQPVVMQVENVLAEESTVSAAALPAPTPRAPPSPANKAASKGKELTEWLDRLEFEDFAPALDGLSSLRDVHFFVTRGELTAVGLEAHGLPRLTVKRFILEVEQVGLVGGIKKGIVCEGREAEASGHGKKRDSLYCRIARSSVAPIVLLPVLLLFFLFFLFSSSSSLQRIRVYMLCLSCPRLVVVGSMSLTVVIGACDRRATKPFFPLLYSQLSFRTLETYKLHSVLSFPLWSPFQ